MGKYNNTFVQCSSTKSMPFYSQTPNMYCMRSIGHIDCEVSIAIPF